MIKEMVFLQFYGGFGGGDLGNLLNQWQQIGVFQYMLPFLIIFALIFGILSKLNLFGEANNKSINAIIALSTALLALQFNVVSVFFSEVFPRLGIVLAAMLVVIVVIGLFAHKKDKVIYNIVLWTSLVAIVVVLLQSFDVFGYSYSHNILGFLPSTWIPYIALIVLAVAVVAGSVKSDKPNTVGGHLMKALGETSQ